jgi:hypothetical protein
MIESTDRNRFSMQPQLGGMQQQMMQPRMMPQLGGMRPQFDMFEQAMNQPTQVAPPMEPPAEQQMRSVLKRDQQSPEENIRRMLEQMRPMQMQIRDLQ